MSCALGNIRREEGGVNALWEYLKGELLTQRPLRSERNTGGYVFTGEEIAHATAWAGRAYARIVRKGRKAPLEIGALRGPPAPEIDKHRRMLQRKFCVLSKFMK